MHAGEHWTSEVVGASKPCQICRRYDHILSSNSLLLNFIFGPAYGTGKTGENMYESDDEDNEFNGYLESANESQGFAQHSAQHTTDGEFKLEMDDDELDDDIDWADGAAVIVPAMADADTDADGGADADAEDTFSFTFINALLGLPRPPG